MGESELKSKTWRKIKITRDSNANLKLLKELKKEGCIEIFDVKTENETVKVKNKILPIGIWGSEKKGYTKWDKFIWAGNDCKYDKIREILGKDKVADAIKLEAHVRNKYDYFVTEDTDFLHKREILKDKFGVNICTSEELKNICKKQD